MVHSPLLRHCVENQAARSLTSQKELKTCTALFRYQEKIVTIKSAAEKFRRPSSRGTQLRMKEDREFVYICVALISALEIIFTSSVSAAIHQLVLVFNTLIFLFLGNRSLY